MKALKYLLAFTLATVLLTVSATSQVQRGIFTMSYEEPGSGTIRTIEMFVPPDYDPSQTYPLILAWHGNGMRAEAMRAMLMPTADTLDVILACPQFGGMNGEQLNVMLNASLQFVTETYAVDRTKVICAGFSMGGGMAYQIGLQVPQIFTGIIGISPAISGRDFTEPMWANIQKLRMATILGTLDFNYDEVDSLMTEITRRQAELLYMRKTGVTHSDPHYFTSYEFVQDFRNAFLYVTRATPTASIDSRTISMSMHPNPATEFVVIEVPKVVGVTRIEIVDMQGRTAQTVEVDGSSGRYVLNDIAHLAAGFYNVRISGGGRVGVETLIISE